MEGTSLLEEKNRISGLVQKRYQKSFRAYFISTLLFLGIVFLAAFYLGDRWGMWFFDNVWYFLKGGSWENGCEYLLKIEEAFDWINLWVLILCEIDKKKEWVWNNRKAKEWFE